MKKLLVCLIMLLSLGCSDVACMKKKKVSNKVSNNELCSDVVLVILEFLADDADDVLRFKDVDTTFCKAFYFYLKNLNGKSPTLTTINKIELNKSFSQSQFEENSFSRNKFRGVFKHFKKNPSRNKFGNYDQILKKHIYGMVTFVSYKDIKCLLLNMLTEDLGFFKGLKKLEIIDCNFFVKKKHVTKQDDLEGLFLKFSNLEGLSIDNAVIDFLPYMRYEILPKKLKTLRLHNVFMAKKDMPSNRLLSFIDRNKGLKSLRISSGFKGDASLTRGKQNNFGTHIKMKKIVESFISNDKLKVILD